MSLVEHAEREMKLAGLYADISDYGDLIPKAIMALVEAHSKQRHSEGSHYLVLDIFNRVINFKTLTPINSDPQYWNDVSDTSGEPMWQSTRDPSYFSRDGGKTFYSLNDKENKK